PVAAGTYNGSPVNIPMTGLTAAQPIGNNLPLPAVHTAPDFGIFVCLRTSASTAHTPCDLNGDHAANAIDMQPLVNAILTGSMSNTYDINHDTEVNVLDLQVL